MAIYKGRVSAVGRNEITIRLEDDGSIEYAEALLRNRFSHVEPVLLPFVEVVDGDTIRVIYEGKEERLRLIGVNAPEVETVDGELVDKEPFGVKATEYLRNQLSGVTHVYVEFEEGKPLFDPHDRLLGHVYLDSNRSNSTMLNAMVLASGYGEVDIFPPHTAYEELFNRIQSKASVEGKNIWSQEEKMLWGYEPRTLDEYVVSLPRSEWPRYFQALAGNVVYKGTDINVRMGDYVVVEGDLSDLRSGMNVYLDVSPEVVKKKISLGGIDDDGSMPVSAVEKIESIDISALVEPMDLHEMRIGHSKLVVPPLSIDIQRLATTQKHSALRTKGSIKTQTGHSDTKIVLNLFFHDIDSINDPENGLRALIAQFKRTPFLPVDNYYLNFVHDIWGVTLANMSMSTVPDFPNSINVQLSLFKFNHTAYLPFVPTLRVAINENKFKWYFQKDLIYEYDPNTMMPRTVNEFAIRDVDRYAPGRLKPIDREMRTGDFKIFVVPEDELTKAKEFSSLSDSDDFDTHYKETTDEYNSVNKDVNTINALMEIKDAFEAIISNENLENKTANFQSTMRSIVTKYNQVEETKLGADIHINNFVITKNNNLQARNIKFNSNAARAVLGESMRADMSIYPEDDTLLKLRNELSESQKSIREIKRLADIEKARSFDSVRDYNFGLSEYHIDEKDNLVLTGIEMSYENTVTSFQMAELDSPTHQYLGGQDTYIKLNFECLSDSALKSLNELMSYTQRITREYRSVIKSGFMRIENDIINLAGITHVLIDNMNVYTVPDFPGRYNVEMILVDFDVMQSKLERTGSVIGKLDSTGRVILPDDTVSNRAQESTSTNRGMMKYGTDLAKTQHYHVEKFMSQFDLYPDLELPTYDEFNTAAENGAGFQKVKPPHPLAKYLDPDFYFKAYDSIMDEIEAQINNKDIMVIKDRAGGSIAMTYGNKHWKVNTGVDIDAAIEEGETEIVEASQQASEEEAQREQEERTDELPTLLSDALSNTDYKKVNKSDVYRMIAEEVSKSNQRENFKGGIKRPGQPDYSPAIIPDYMGEWLAYTLSQGHQFIENEDGDIVPYQHRDRYGVFLLSKRDLPMTIYDEVTRSGYPAYNTSSVEVVVDHSTFDAAIRSYKVNIKMGIAKMVKAFHDITGLGDNNIEEQKYLASLIAGNLRRMVDSIEEDKRSLEEQIKEYNERIKQQDAYLNALKGLEAYGSHPQINKEQTRRYIEDTLRPKDFKEEDREMRAALQAKIDDLNSRQNELRSFQREFENMSRTGIINKNANSANVYNKFLWILAVYKHFDLEDVTGKSFDQLWVEFEASNLMARTVQYGGRNYNYYDFDSENYADRVEARFKVDPHEVLESPLSVNLKGSLTSVDIDLLTNEVQLPDIVEAGVNNEDVADVAADMWHDEKMYDMRNRMIRAFPTFHLFLIEEGRRIKRWKLWDNFYGFSAISSIDVIKSRKIAADTAVIRLSNVYGGIANEEVSGDYDTPETNYNFRQWVSHALPTASPTEEQIEKHDKAKKSLILREGSRIHLRVGYGSDASALPIVFNGTITEYKIGEIIEIVAQGDGIELSNPLPYGDNATTGNFGFGAEPRNIIGNLMTAEGIGSKIIKWMTGGVVGWGHNKHGVQHFGDVKFTMGKLFNGFGEIGHNLHYGINNGSEFTYTRNNEIDNPMDVRFFSSPFEWFRMKNEAPNITIDLHDKSIWDVAQICAMATTNYIAAVHPFGFRSTLFYGKPHHTLAYDYDVVDAEQLGQMDDKEKFDSYGNYLYHLSDTENLYIKLKRKPFQQWHAVTSMMDIISNDIKASSEGVYNNVIAKYHAEPAAILGNLLSRGRPTEEIAVAHADRDIYPQYQKTITIDSQIKCRGNWLLGMIPGISWLYGKYHNYHVTKASAIMVAQSAVRDYMKDMYKGQITMVGKPEIKPHDAIYLMDLYNEMYGIAEVEQVVHHMDASTGFITTINPDAAVAVTDPDMYHIWSWQSSVAIAGLSSGMLKAGLIWVTTSEAIKNRLSASLLARGARWVAGTRPFTAIANHKLYTGAKNVLTTIARASGVVRAGSIAAALSSAGASLVLGGLVSLALKSVDVMIKRYLDLSQCIIISPLLYKAKPFTAAMNGSEGIIVGTSGSLTNAKWLEGVLRGTFKAVSSLDSFFSLGTSSYEAISVVEDADYKDDPYLSVLGKIDPALSSEFQSYYTAQSQLLKEEYDEKLQYK